MNSQEETALVHLPEVDRAIQSGMIGQHIYSAAAAMASKEGCVFHQAVYGFNQFDKPNKKITFDYLFDVSSLTKPLVTVLSVISLVSKGKLSLDAPVSRLLKDFSGPIWDKILLENLLDHTSGLVSHKPFFEQIKQEEQSLPLAQQTLGSVRALPKMRALIAKTPPQTAPNVLSVYSDLNFMILGFIIESIVGKRLDVFVLQEIYKPLGLSAKDLGFVELGVPRKAGSLLYVATESCSWRQKTLLGEVHDQNAWAMGGIAGHAGLFATVHAVHCLGVAILNSYLGKPDAPFHAGTMKRFLTKSKRACNKTWALGFDMPAAKDSLAGQKMSRNAVGHLGFTGCSFWIDLQSQCVSVLLTNRVHKTPQGKDEFMRQLRPRVEDLFASFAQGFVPVKEEPEEEDPYAEIRKREEKKKLGQKGISGSVAGQVTSHTKK